MRPSFPKGPFLACLRPTSPCQAMPPAALDSLGMGCVQLSLEKLQQCSKPSPRGQSEGENVLRLHSCPTQDWHTLHPFRAGDKRHIRGSQTLAKLSFEKSPPFWILGWGEVKSKPHSLL